MERELSASHWQAGRDIEHPNRITADDLRVKPLYAGASGMGPRTDMVRIGVLAAHGHHAIGKTAHAAASRTHARLNGLLDALARPSARARG